MQRTENEKGQKCGCRADRMADKRVPAAGSFILRRNDMNEDRGAKAWEEPGFLKTEAQTTNNAGDHQGGPTAIQSPPQIQARKCGLDGQRDQIDSRYP